MLQFLVWMGIYYLSIKIMTKFAGRNSPLWGMTFVLISFFVIPISTIVSMLFISVFTVLNNTLIFILLNLLFNFLITLSFALILGIFLKKRDIRKRLKKTKINYKLVTIFIIMIGILILFLIYLNTKKLDTWSTVLIVMMTTQSILYYKQSKLKTDITIDELENQDFILFLRTFNSNIISSKPQKPIKTYEWWKHTLSSKKLTVEEILERKIFTIDEYIRKIIPKNIPFVALGNPEDYLPTFGSIKIYTDDDKWKETVREYMKYSKKIIILEGFSEAILWELKYIKKYVNPNKVIIITYPENFRRN